MSRIERFDSLMCSNWQCKKVSKVYDMQQEYEFRSNRGDHITLLCPYCGDFVEEVIADADGDFWEA